MPKSMMKRASYEFRLVVFGVCLSATVVLLGGCLYDKYPTQDANVEPSAIAFIKPGITTRAEVVENLGDPGLEWKAEQGIAYLWITSKKWHIGHASCRPVTQNAFAVQFHGQQRVLRHQFFREDETMKMEAKILQWLKSGANFTAPKNSHQ
jgi:hypothetical protein